MLLAVVAVVATGCHKENNGDDNGGGNGGGGNDPTVTTYTVTFNANGGTGEMQPQAFTEGETKALTANAFTYQYHTFVNWNTVADGTGTAYTNGQETSLTQNITLYAQWKALKGTLNGHEWIDLGLPSGTLWATCNVGANTPEAYGDYFAWGETQPQASNTYNWSSYKYCNGSYNTLTKYCSNASYGNNGFTDTLTVLLPEDDAATANWGSGWRMPTQTELRELKDNCTVTLTTQNGVNGRLFTAANGNSVFLPAAGYRWGSGLNYGGSYGRYWSSSLGTDYPGFAWYLYFYSDNYDMDGDGRYYGFSVRPVCASQN